MIIFQNGDGDEDKNDTQPKVRTTSGIKINVIF